MKWMPLTYIRFDSPELMLRCSRRSIGATSGFGSARRLRVAKITLMALRAHPWGRERRLRLPRELTSDKRSVMTVVGRRH
jgi:hypothetical protein